LATIEHSSQQFGELAKLIVKAGLEALHLKLKTKGFGCGALVLGLADTADLVCRLERIGS
jgi:hypothetical protein